MAPTNFTQHRREMNSAFRELDACELRPKLFPTVLVLLLCVHFANCGRKPLHPGQMVSLELALRLQVAKVHELWAVGVHGSSTHSMCSCCLEPIQLIPIPAVRVTTLRPWPNSRLLQPGCRFFGVSSCELVPMQPDWKRPCCRRSMTSIVLRRTSRTGLPTLSVGPTLHGAGGSTTCAGGGRRASILAPASAHRHVLGLWISPLKPRAMPCHRLSRRIERFWDTGLLCHVATLVARGCVVLRMGRLTALKKPQDGVRGIVVSDVFRRIMQEQSRNNAQWLVSGRSGSFRLRLTQCHAEGVVDYGRWRPCSAFLSGSFMETRPLSCGKMILEESTAFFKEKVGSKETR